MLRIAIVGLGPWGVCALERVVSTARTRSGLPPLRVDVIEPRTPGSGVYDVEQPDYLLLNNPCGQLSLFPFTPDGERPSYGLGLYEWVSAEGYRWRGGRLVRDPEGDPVERHHFLPRRVMGEYLQWFYRALVAGAPRDIEIVHHATSAVDIVPAPGGESVVLEQGGTVEADHVIVTSGHTANEESAGRASHPPQRAAYPVSSYVETVEAGQTVAISGLGLVGIDVLIALTEGRGGRFLPDGAELLRYVPSGREPRIHMYSRSGLPYTAKSVTGSDLAGFYEPTICTPEALLALRGSAQGTDRGIDVRSGLLPLLFAEMYVRYYAQAAETAASADEAGRVREALRSAWAEGRFEDERSRMAERYGAFDAEGLFFGHQTRYESAADYEQAVYDALATDLREAQVPNGASPVKAAAEVFRIFRDPIRSVIEYGGPSLESYLDFHADIRSRINRLVAGPPAIRSQQMLALIHAGILHLPYGPAPALGHVPGSRTRTRISSTLLRHGHSDDVDVVIRGHLEEPRLDGSASQLLRALYARGRVSQFRYGSVTVGSVDLTLEGHPIDLDGLPQERIWMFGVLTEGVRHFTHYIPSPRSRIRAFEDIGASVEAILG